MDACEAVEHELEKVLGKFNSIKDHGNSVLENIINHFQSLQNELQQCPPNHELTPPQVSILQETVNKARDTVQRLGNDHRDLHSSVSKIGKAIDKHFVAEFSACGKEEVFNNDDAVKLLNQVICQHFYRQGMLDISEALAADSGLVIEKEEREPFAEITFVLENLKKHDVEPALKWAFKNKVFLDARESLLEFKLHQLMFITIIKKGISSQTEAVMYARQHFKPFSKKHEKDIQNLMGLLLYLPQGLVDSPYSSYLQPTLWSEAIEIFTRESCIFLGLSIDSPLSVSIDVGSIALPALLNLQQVMQQRRVGSMWSGRDELPIEIDIGMDKQFHSVFACPILRQQSSDTNPPMRLICGHIMSRDALTKLSNNLHKLKCPYCPMDQNMSEAKRIYF